MSMKRRAGPDFLCIGSHKSATGWLYDQVAAHPKAAMPPIKELHYFDQAGSRGGLSILKRHLLAARKLGPAGLAQRMHRPYTEADDAFLRAAEVLRSRMSIPAYESLFGFKRGLLSGDVTPNYSGIPVETIRAIKKGMPGIRIVFLVRDPVQRFWSHVSFAARRKTLDRRSVRDWPYVKQFLLDGAASRSYPTQIYRRWRQCFSPEDILVGYFDEIATDPAGARDRIFAFLGLDIIGDAHPLPASYDRKAKSRRIKCPDAIKERLVEHFRQEIRDCADLFGGPCMSWLARYAIDSSAHAPVGSVTERVQTRV